MSISFSCVIFVSIIYVTNSANILGVFITPSPSHLIIHMSVMEALLQQGHNVTVITTLPLKDKNPQLTYRHIHLKNSVGNFGNTVKNLMNVTKQNYNIFVQFKRSVHISLDLLNEQKAAFEDDKFKKFIANEDEHFDLVVLGYLFNDYQFGLAAHFNCPLALIWVNEPMDMILSLIGNPGATSYVPVPMMAKISDLSSFSGRFMNFVFTQLSHFANFLKDLWNKSVYNKYFPPTKYPTYEQMQKNVSLILCNYHFTEGIPRPYVPALIEIGGVQIKEKPGKLPKDIAKFLDGANENGAILFSLGTNIRSDHINVNVLRRIYNVLSQLPQRTIFKYDEVINVLGNSSNILILNWLPQNDILAHRNLKLFITHGGKGGITEAEFHGVPMIGLPLFGDQPNNVKQIVDKGYAISIEDINEMTEDDFRNAINEVLSNQKYRMTVKKFSDIYKDRPMSAKQSAVFWLEYIIRYNGAPHMQSPLKSLNIIEANNLDVIAMLLFLFYITIRIAKFIIIYLFRKIYHKKSSMREKKLKKN